MPQIPLGEPQQVVRGGQAVEAINAKEERLFGDTLSALGRSIQQLKQENDRMALSAGKEEYERESYRLLTSSRAEYNSLDQTGLSFDDYVKPQLDTLKQQLKSKYKIQDDNAWTGVTFGVENSLVPRFMAEEAKQAVEMQQQIEANRTANMAQTILDSKNPVVEMNGFFAKNQRLVDEGIAAGTYLPEQREAVVAQKNREAVVATMDAFTSKEVPDYKNAINTLNASRQFFDAESYRKESDRLKREWADFENRTYTTEQRLRAQEERALKEKQEGAERVLALDREAIANDPKKIADWNKKVEAAFVNNDLTIEQRNKLYNFEPFRGESQDLFLEQKMFGDLASGKLSVSGALKQLDSPAYVGRMSLEQRSELKSRLLSLREAERDRGEKYQEIAVRETLDAIEAQVKSTVDYAVRPKQGDALIAAVRARASEFQAKVGRPMTYQERQDFIEKNASRYNIPVKEQSLRRTNNPESQLPRLKKELSDLAKRARQPGLTDQQKRGIVQEIQQRKSEIDRIEREKGVR